MSRSLNETCECELNVYKSDWPQHYLVTDLVSAIGSHIQIKWVPENLYTFTIWPALEKVYKFSGTHFNSKTTQINKRGGVKCDQYFVAL